MGHHIGIKRLFGVFLFVFQSVKQAQTVRSKLFALEVLAYLCMGADPHALFTLYPLVTPDPRPPALVTPRLDRGSTCPTTGLSGQAR